MLALEDLKNLDDEGVRAHIVADYEVDRAVVDKFDILVAYESVGSWGCDSSSWFLLRDRETGKLFEINGSHCSCYGFEGQFEPEETNVAALQHRAEKGDLTYLGGYDASLGENSNVMVEFVKGLADE